MAKVLSSNVFYFLQKEVTGGDQDRDYGKFNSEGDKLYPIIPGGEVTLSDNPQQQVVETNIGHGYPYFATKTGIREITGSFTCLVDAGSAGANALALIQWGSTLDGTSKDLPSWSLGKGGLAPSANTLDEIWLGLKPQTMTLTSGADSGAQRRTAAYDLVGRAAFYGSGVSTLTSDFVVDADPVVQPASPLAEDDNLYPNINATANVGYYHHDIGASGLTLHPTASAAAFNATVSDVSMTFTNTMDIGNGTGIYPQWCAFTGRQVTCDLTVEFDTTTALAMRDSLVGTGSPTACTLKLVYNGPGAGDDLTLELKGDVLVTAFEPQLALGTVARANISLMARLGHPGGSGAFTTDFAVTVA